MCMYVHCLNNYSLQNGNTPLHCAAQNGHTICVERLLSTPGIEVNIGNKVSLIDCRNGAV